jgi:hypothetical protein
VPSSISVKRSPWRIGLLAMVFWVAPWRAWSQENTLVKQSEISAGGMFAGFDDSLSLAATSLLDARVPAAPPATGKSTEVRAALDDDRVARRWIMEGPSVATSRWNGLRPTVEPILQSHGVPEYLSAIILVESGARAMALSGKGARGLWQLMPDTARRYGLRVDDRQDDRVDTLKATNAAALYLHDLFVRFGDWKLALAAYNTGEVNVENAIAKAHTQEFDQLVRLGRLPLETSNYVPLVLATAGSSGLRSLRVGSHERLTSTEIFASSSR